MNNYELDFWIEAVGDKRLPNETDDELSDRLKKIFGFTEEAFRIHL